MKKTTQTKEVLLEQLCKTPIVQIACEKLGISRMTFYRWKNDDPDFAKHVEEALLAGRMMVNDLAESQLIGAVKDRNISAIIAWLKHNHPNYKTRVEIEGAVNIIQELPPEEKKLVQEKFKLLYGVDIHDYGQH